MKVNSGYDLNASGNLKSASGKLLDSPKIQRRKVIKLYVNKSILPFIVKIIKSNESVLLKNTPGVRFFIDDINKYVREMVKKVKNLTEINEDLEKKLLYLQGRVDQLGLGGRLNISDIQTSVEHDLIKDKLFKELNSLSWWNIYKKYLIKQKIVQFVWKY